MMLLLMPIYTTNTTLDWQIKYLRSGSKGNGVLQVNMRQLQMTKIILLYQGLMAVVISTASYLLQNINRLVLVNFSWPLFCALIIYLVGKLGNWAPWSSVGEQINCVDICSLSEPVIYFPVLDMLYVWCMLLILSKNTHLHCVWVNRLISLQKRYRYDTAMWMHFLEYNVTVFEGLFCASTREHAWRFICWFCCCCCFGVFLYIVKTLLKV